MIIDVQLVLLRYNQLAKCYLFFYSNLLSILLKFVYIIHLMDLILNHLVSTSDIDGQYHVVWISANNVVIKIWLGHPDMIHNPNSLSLQLTKQVKKIDFHNTTTGQVSYIFFTNTSVSLCWLFTFSSLESVQRLTHWAYFYCSTQY